MNAYEELRAALLNASSQVGARLTEYAPSLLGAALLLLAGWLIARVLRALAVRLMNLLELLLHRLLRGHAARAIPSGSVEVVGSVLFWVVIAFFAAAAAHVLGLGVLSTWLQGLMGYLPTLVAGVLIVLAGVLFAGLARDLTVAGLATLAEPQRSLLGRAVQASILVTAIAVGADQIGIQITFLVVLAAVVTSAVVGGVALAVSLGARSYVANLIGAHYLRQAFAAGQRVRIGAVEGTIVELTSVSVVLETEEGRVTIPGKVYNEEPIMLLTPRGGGA